jgi:U3 small nucleolar RNA-associated protein 15
VKQFRYGDALDEALSTRNPSDVILLLEELGKRRGLTIALSCRDDEALEPILAYITRHLTRPGYSPVLMGVAHKILDIYEPLIGKSEALDHFIVKLKAQVRGEYFTQIMLYRVVGTLDGILSTVDGGAQL